MSGFADVYKRLCERYPDERDRGRAFEPLVKRVFETAPMYRERFLRGSWMGRMVGAGWGRHRYRHRCQASRWRPGSDSMQVPRPNRKTHHKLFSCRISKKRPNGQPYVERYIVTTATEWSDNAERALSRIDPPVQRVDFFGLDSSAIDWDAYLENETAPLRERPRKQLRPHQRIALGKVLTGFDAVDRGKLIMACGTGKTLTALRIAEKIAGFKRACTYLPLLRSPYSHSPCGSGVEMLRARLRAFRRLFGYETRQE